MKNTIDSRVFYIGTLVMSLNELGEKLGEKRSNLQKLIDTTEDISVKLKSVLEFDILTSQTRMLTIIVKALEDKDFDGLLKYQDEVEALYLQIKESYPDYERDLADVKNHFIFTDRVKELMPKLSCVSFEDTEHCFEMTQEACVSAVKELIYNKRLMADEGKTQALLDKEKDLKQILTYFINQP